MEKRLCPFIQRLATNSLLRNTLRHELKAIRPSFPRYFSSLTRFVQGKNDGPILDFPDMGPPIPEQIARPNENMEQKRARLFYQSRKRGISENGLLLSTFASKHLHKFDEKLLNQYDTMINKPSNDWELFYWMTEKKPTPSEFDNEVMKMLKEHTRNEKMETRYRMPDLDENTTPKSEKN